MIKSIAYTLGIAICLIFSLLLVSQHKAVAFALINISRSWNIYAMSISLPLQNQPICKIRTGAKVVAITLDDGPDPRYTLPILETLKSRHVKATFFLVGTEAEKYPDIVRQIAHHGHEIGNHTQTHPEMKDLSYKQIVREISAGDDILQSITGKRPYYFRPPKGVINEMTQKAISDSGHITVLWDLGLENSRCQTPAEMSARILKNIRPGSIILLHDGRLVRSKSVQALPMMLDGLKENGYSFVTVTELLNSRTT